MSTVWTKLKYIVVKNADGIEEIFVFPSAINHDRFWETLTHCRMGPDSNWSREYRNAEVISAGFVTSQGVCMGESFSLKLKTRPFIDTCLLGLADTTFVSA